MDDVTDSFRQDRQNEDGQRHHEHGDLRVGHAGQMRGGKGREPEGKGGGPGCRSGEGNHRNSKCLPLRRRGYVHGIDV